MFGGIFFGCTVSEGAFCTAHCPQTAAVPLPLSLNCVLAQYYDSDRPNSFDAEPARSCWSGWWWMYAFRWARGAGLPAGRRFRQRPKVGGPHADARSRATAEYARLFTGAKMLTTLVSVAIGT